MFSVAAVFADTNTSQGSVATRMSVLGYFLTSFAE